MGQELPDGNGRMGVERVSDHKREIVIDGIRQGELPLLPELHGSSGSDRFGDRPYVEHGLRRHRELLDDVRPALPLGPGNPAIFHQAGSETWKMRLFHRGLNELIQVGEEITPGYHSCPSGDNSSYYHIRSDGERAGSA